MPRRSSKSPDSMAEAFEGIRSDYAAARSSRYRRRRTGLNPMGSGADYHYRNEVDYLKLLEQARDFDRNDVIVGQMIDRVCDNTVQGGFRLDVHTGDDGVDTELEARWKDWSEDPDQCDVAGEMAFAEMEWLSLRHMLVDGDVLVLPLASDHLQMVEGHRLRTPSNTKQNVVNGVLLDSQRKRLEYWLTKDDIDPNQGLKLVSDIAKIPARNAAGDRQVFHILNRKRATQTRGVTAFAPIFDTLGMFEDINFARLVQQQVVSCFAILRQRGDEFKPNGPDAKTGAESKDTQADGSSRTIQGISPGMDIAGAPGEKIEGFSPNVPGPQVLEHVRLILQLAGVNLGLPLVLVLLDASETNFSGFRGAVEQARLGFRRNQSGLARRLHCPTYKWRVRSWIADDPALARAAANPKILMYSHTWHPPRWPYIQPVEDAQAAVVRMKSMLTSPRREHAEDGQDFYEIADESLADNGYAIEAAIKEAVRINTANPDNPDPVHWRELISLPMPEGITMTIGGTPPAAAKPADGEKPGQPGQPAKKPPVPAKKDTSNG